ncbi:MAG: choice-of-anchor E domain-containing protein [Rubricoccaceae bacterium]|nr:choice-of-anchor E domain-containing protein [Rubricoccaceae bacterium]
MSTTIYAGVMNVAQEIEYFHIHNEVDCWTKSSCWDSSTKSKELEFEGFDSLGIGGTLIGVSIDYYSQFKFWTKLTVVDPYTKYEDNVKGYGGAEKKLTIALDLPGGDWDKVSKSLSTRCYDDDGFCKDTEAVVKFFSGSLDYGIENIPLTSFLGSFDVDLTDWLKTFVSSCYDDEDKCKSEAGNWWKGKVKVTYKYMVPEPATVGMIGAGLLLLSFTARVRRNQPA